MMTLVPFLHPLHDSTWAMTARLAFPGSAAEVAAPLFEDGPNLAERSPVSSATGGVW